MRIARHLFAAQAGRAAVAVFGLWTALWAAGLAWHVIAVGEPSAAAVAAVAAAAFPDAVRVAAPLAVAQHVLFLRESGEWEALCTAGAAPHGVAAWLLLPWLPFAAALEVHVASATPAATARLTDGAAEQVVTDVARFARAVRRAGVAVGTAGEETRVLVATGSAAVGVAWRGRPERAPDAATLDGVSATVLLDDALVRVRGERARFALASPPRPLSARVEQELSSDFLAGAGHVWSRARSAVGGAPAAELGDRERARRRLVIPAFALALGVALWPLLARRTPHAAVVWCGAALPALALSAFVPRLGGLA